MFVKPKGLRYYDFLVALHASFDLDWYLEIGCRTGSSLVHSRAKTIAVDPQFLIESNVIVAKPALLAFQQPSDDFFKSDFLRNAGIKLSFSFLDGMHLFEFLLRDFMNTEANGTSESVICLHDCVPFDHEMTTRDLDNIPRKAWTGDVWKLLPILKEFRPELKVTVLDSRPTGMVMVSGLDPKNTVLKENYNAILKRFTQMDLASYGVERFFSEFRMSSTSAYLADGYPDFAPHMRRALTAAE